MATPPTVGQNRRSRLRRLLEVPAVGGSIRPGWAPVLIAAAMVGVAFWWVETPSAWPWPYLPVLLAVSAVLAGCWWVLARRDGPRFAHLTAPEMGAVLLGFGVAGVASSVLAVVFDSGLQSPFTPADSPSFAVVQTVVVSMATAVVEEAPAAAVVLAAAALIALRRPWTGWAPWIAIGVGAASRVALHVPLWGSEAVIRCGFALIMAWLFWRLRRIWPLIVGHVLWDIPPVLSQVTPAASVSAAMTWLSQLWCVAGLAAVVSVFLTVRPDRALRVRSLDKG